MKTTENGFKFKVKKHVTLPLLKIKPNGLPAFVRFEGAMFLGKKIETGSEADKKKEPATLAHVVNLETGEEMQIICPMMLRTQLTEAYPSDAYVGHCFAVRITRDPEKKYNHVSITEIEPESEPGETVQSAGFEPPDNPPSTIRGTSVKAARNASKKRK